MRKSQSFSGSIRANDQEGRDEENENGVSTRCNRGGDTAWAPRSSAGRTAGSAGPRRRNAQLRWAVRGRTRSKSNGFPVVRQGDSATDPALNCLFRLLPAPDPPRL